MNKTDKNAHSDSLTQREIKKENLVLRTEGFSVIFNGIIDEQNPASYLSPFLDKVHNDILEKGLSSIEIDIRDLAYINSSGIKEIIKWLIKIASLNNTPKYTIIFLCNKESRWQGLSIDTIQKLLPERIYKKYV